jgi:hypothetical protein
MCAALATNKQAKRHRGGCCLSVGTALEATVYVPGDPPSLGSLPNSKRWTQLESPVKRTEEYG